MSFSYCLFVGRGCNGNGDRLQVARWLGGDVELHVLMVFGSCPRSRTGERGGGSWYHRGDVVLHICSPRLALAVNKKTLRRGKGLGSPEAMSVCVYSPAS